MCGMWLATTKRVTRRLPLGPENGYSSPIPKKVKSDGRLKNTTRMLHTMRTIDNMRMLQTACVICKNHHGQPEYGT